MAVVTGIRHWSTASYTRVAIDLNVAPGEEIKYEAARVENPDRIFFDLGHAKLAPEMVGKSFSVTDDGFLTRVRAAQFTGDVTRVVLDVHHVTEYSAFLLPNPLRLIIDIHGGQEKPETGSRKPEVASAAVPAANGPVANAGGCCGGVSDCDSEAGWAGGCGVEFAADAGYGWECELWVADAEYGSGGEGKSVAPPRVVIASKPTPARPVPNTVTKNSADTSSEVADVSEQPGKVEATRKPTSKPIAETSAEDVASADHYVPRSRRNVATLSGGGGRRADGALRVNAAHRGEGEPAARAASYGGWGDVVGAGAGVEDWADCD